MQITLPDYLSLSYLSGPQGRAQYWVCKFRDYEGGRGATAQEAIDTAQRVHLVSPTRFAEYDDLGQLDDLLEDL